MKGLKGILSHASTDYNFKGARNYKKDILKIRDTVFNNKSINKIMSHILFKKTKNYKTDLIISIESKYISDLSTLVTLKLILIYSVKILNYKIKFRFINKLIDDQTLLIRSSLYPYINVWINNENIGDFTKNYYGKHTYSTILTNNKNNKDSNYISKLGTTVMSILKNFGLEESIANEMTELVIEIVNNVFEHTNDDCILELLYSDSYLQRPSESIRIPVKVLYLSCVSVTETLMWLPLEKAIIKQKENTSGKQIVLKALNQHKKLFDNEYTISDFLFISTFQKTVSSRKDSVNSGGTGLTKVIMSLQDHEEIKDKQSYVLSGNKVVHFTDEFLKINLDGTIGFNNNNDYFNERPSNNIYKKIDYSFPGTIVNIGLGFETKENINEKN